MARREFRRLKQVRRMVLLFSMSSLVFADKLYLKFLHVMEISSFL